MKKDWPPRCCGCNLFIGYKDLNSKRVLTYVPYGSWNDWEPPSPEYIHLKCWKKMPPERRQTINNIAWQASERIREDAKQKQGVAAP